jgi:TPR repeat protein
MYQNGRGLPLDYIEAYTWFSLATAQGNRAAIEARKSLAKIMTKHQVSVAEARVSEWQTRHQPKQVEELDGEQIAEKADAGQ